jgi:hypothetical protein
VPKSAVSTVGFLWDGARQPDLWGFCGVGINAWRPPLQRRSRLAGAREVAAGAARSVGYPMLWRQTCCAVELYQRAAKIAGEELPGSYRPGSRANKTRR